MINKTLIEFGIRPISDNHLNNIYYKNPSGSHISIKSIYLLSMFL